MAIMAILAGIMLVTINPALQLKKGRDSQRKSDLKIIQSALELYRSDQGYYPPQSSNAIPVCSGGGLWDDCNSGSPTVYLQNIPEDPKTSSISYYYCTDTSCGAPSNDGYALYACLENASDTSAQGNVTDLSYLGGTGGRCSNTAIYKKYYFVVNP